MQVPPRTEQEFWHRLLLEVRAIRYLLTLVLCALGIVIGLLR